MNKDEAGSIVHWLKINEKLMQELSTLTAKVAELEKRLEVAHYNIELRTKENHDIINNHDESRWTYWRKRSGEMTDAWRDQRDSALNLTAKVKRYEEALKEIADQKISGSDVYDASELMIEVARAALNQGES